MLNETIVSVLEKRFTDIREHLRTLYDLVVMGNFRTVVELGAGQSTYVLCAAVNKTGGRLFSLDLLPEAHLRGYLEGEGVLEKEPNYTFVCGDDMKAVKTWETPIDFLFIDSSHQYQNTLDELKEWGKWVRVGGKIAMHDTHHTVGHAVGCRTALDKFLNDNPGLFFALHFDNCGGLSVLTKLK